MSSKEKKAAINRILKDAQKAEMPSAVTPMNFKLRPAAFDSEDWIFFDQSSSFETQEIIEIDPSWIW